MIGEIKIADVTRGFMYSYYDELRQKDALQGNHVNSPHVKISSRTIKEIDKILSPAFKWAVNREMISINPMYGMEKPTYNAPKRQQWTVEEFLSAVSICHDETLSLAMEIMFYGTLRSCEAAGLKWDCVDFSSEYPCIQIKREIVLLNRKAIQDTGTMGNIEETFSLNGTTKKVIVLQKTLKTSASNRLIYIPRTLAEKLKNHWNHQKERERYFPDYPQNNLVLEHDFGRPYTANLLNKQFKRFIRKNGLREVDMYSLRHSGATEKLRRTRDIKAVQADMGHTTTQMLLNVYATVPEDDRKRVAKNMDSIYDENGQYP